MDAWLWAREIIHVCTMWSSADGFHQGVERGRIVRDMGGGSIAIVVGIPVVIGIVVVLLAKSLGSSQERQFQSRALSNHSNTLAKAVARRYNSTNYGNHKKKSTNYSFYMRH
jgi:hypothetical protein